MPCISPFTANDFDVAMGPQSGGGVLSIMGSTPAALSAVTGNAAGWYSSSRLGFQDYSSTPALKTYDTGTTAIATLDSAGANRTGFGGSKWAAQLSGVRRSNGATLSLAGLSGADVCCSMDETGRLATITSYATGAGVTVYSAAGVSIFSASTLLASTGIALRQGILSYLDATDGWQLIDVTTGRTVSGWLPRMNISQLIPFTIGSSVGVLEYDAAESQLSVRLANQLTGLVIPTVGSEYNVDVQGTDTNELRVAWSTGPGEAPSELVVLDVNTSTGATELGTVSGGNVVFATGPTLEGETFSGANAGGNRLPIHTQPVIDKTTGYMTKPWRDALQTTNNSVQTIQTAANNRPVVTPSPAFGVMTDPQGDSVNAVVPHDTVTLTSVNGSVEIVANPATKTIDLAAVSSTGSDVALHRLCGGM